MDAIDLSPGSLIKPAKSYTSTSLHDAVKLRIGKQGLAAAAPQTIPEYFRESVAKYAQLPALVYERKLNKDKEHEQDKATLAAKGGGGGGGSSGSEWITINYAQYAENVQQSALVLLHVGLQPRSSVGILAANCPEWFYVLFGTMRAGGVVAGIYPTNSAEAVYHVLDTSEATVCVVDDAAQMAKVRAVRKRLPRLRAVLQLNGPFEEFVGNEEGYYRWEDMVQRQFGADLLEELERRENNVAANECANLIYTSGTTGMPKAAMLSHDGIIIAIKSIRASMTNIVDGTEVCVTYLPLSHIAAQLFDVFLPLFHGGRVYFADRYALKGSLGRYFKKARPTAIFGVPRIYEKIQESLLAEEQKSSFVSKYILQMARETMEEYHMHRISGKTPSSVKYWLASNVTRKIKGALGFDRCKIFWTGGAVTAEHVKRFFLSVDMPLYDIFGLTESGGATNMLFEASNLQTVGKPLEGVEIKIHNPDGEGHGEICMRGRTCFMGYLHNPEKTRETIKDDGWLYSGDIGYLDTEGNLYITGRIKELIITAGGENIPPVHIEDLIKKELPIISNAMVVGDRKKYLAVLLTIRTEIDLYTGQPRDELQPEAIDWFHELGLDYTLLSQALNIPADNKVFDASNVEVNPHPKILKAIEAGIKRANANAISNAQKVQKFSILPHDFSVPTGELGPTLKVRRNIVAQKYATIIERMYQ